jgi:hypothetical protein
VGFRGFPWLDLFLGFPWLKAPVLPLPRDSKNIKKDSTDYHSLKWRFEQSAVNMASCGYSWVMASRGDGAWVPGNVDRQAG